MKVTVYKFGKLQFYKYVVTFACYRNKWILCKHKNRTTWETSGGHIETGETPPEAAKRELYEETGSSDFEIIPVCDYWACDEPHETDKITWANGQVFLANIKEIGPLPDNEMECINFFETYPQNLTYPDITNELFPYVINEINRNGQEEIKQKNSETLRCGFIQIETYYKKYFFTSERLEGHRHKICKKHKTLIAAVQIRCLMLWLKTS